jgi:DNA-binding response OmpR family regulator
MARVLLINDEADLIDMCEIVLEKHGHSVRHALAPHRMRDLVTLANWRPDLVLLDLVMPGTTGEAVLERLRRLRGTAHVPVVIMSAVPDLEKVALEMGANGFLEKPFDPDGLTEAVDRALAFDGAPRSLRHGSPPDTSRHDSQR